MNGTRGLTYFLPFFFCLKPPPPPPPIFPEILGEDPVETLNGVVIGAITTRSIGPDEWKQKWVLMGQKRTAFFGCPLKIFANIFILCTFAVCTFVIWNCRPTVLKRGGANTPILASGWWEVRASSSCCCSSGSSCSCSCFLKLQMSPIHWMLIFVVFIVWMLFFYTILTWMHMHFTSFTWIDHVYPVYPIYHV